MKSLGAIVHDEKPRLLIVDDSELIRRGVAKLISSEPGWAVCGQAVNGEQAMHMAQALRPDVVLLDISMPGMGGMETARQLRQNMPDIKILVLSQHAASYLLPQVLKAGADGCLDKSRLSADLVSAIRGLVETSGPK